MKTMKLIRFGWIVPFVLLMTIAATDSSCKKQAKCGCGKDVIFTVTSEKAFVYFNEETGTAYFNPITNSLATFYFCNPSEMMPVLTNYESGDILLITADIYYDCNYMYQTSNSSYYQPIYQVYNAQVTLVEDDLYGK